MVVPPIHPYESLFAAFARSEVRHVLVGGLAVLLRGHVRLTVDIDLVIDLEPAAANRAIEALLATGFRPTAPVDARKFADEAVRRSWIAEKNLRVLSFHHDEDPLAVVDVFVESPLPFDELWSRSERLPYRRTTVAVASIRDLLTLKRQAGRPQDLEDIARLEEIERRNASGRSGS